MQCGEANDRECANGSLDGALDGMGKESTVVARCCESSKLLLGFDESRSRIVSQFQETEL